MSAVVSVIIPVYNREHCLEETIESLLSQTFGTDGLEILLVNDGSTDGSLALCRKLAEQHPFIRVIDKPNGGVSSARNAGIKVATGKYLMLLDSDDSISDNAIAEIVKFFDVNYDAVDLVVYSMLNCYASGLETPHPRDKHFKKGTGVYPLAETANITLSTVNVCVKNDGNVPLFDETLKMGEDQKFVNTVVFRLGAVGYVAEAKYRYTRNAVSSSSRVGNRPVNCYDDMIALFEFFMDMAEAHPESASYAYRMVLYNVSWRLKGDYLFPDFCEGEELARQEERLASIMRRIPPKDYAKCTFMTRQHRYFLMRKYGLLPDDLELNFGFKRVSLKVSEDYTWKAGLPRMRFNRILRRNGSFHFEGYITGTPFLDLGKPQLAFLVGDRRIEVSVTESTFSYLQSKYQVTKAWNFSFDLPFDGSQALTLKPVGEVDGLPIRAFYLPAWCRRHNAKRLGDMLYFSDAIVTFQANELSLKHKGPRGKLRERAAEKQLETLPNWPELKALGKKARAASRRSRIWLYVDNPASGQVGDAFSQLQHDYSINDGVKRYYAVEEASELGKRFPELAEAFLEYSSDEHKIVSLASEKLITSFLEAYIMYPFTGAERDYVSFGIREQEVIYTQHGVLHSHMPWYFGYDRNLFDREVISTDFERRNLTQNYAFTDAQLIPCGMTRFDTASQSDGNNHRAVLVPSWRSYLVQGAALDRQGDPEVMKRSSFGKGLLGFLEKVSQSGVLERNDYVLEVKLHPNFNCYDGVFTSDDPRIMFISGEIDPGDYDIAITDYSSFIYDFVYAGCKVMYFLPDEREFKTGYNHYNSLDLPFEEGFGPYSSTAEKAAEDFVSLIEGGDPNEELYRQRAENFFLWRDGKNRDRLYEALIKG